MSLTFIDFSMILGWRWGRDLLRGTLKESIETEKESMTMAPLGEQ
jgi:hypothetical protein